MAQRLIHVSSYVQPSNPINGPGICGLTQPFHVTALLDGEVTFNTTYTLDCPMIAALNDWLSDVVEPAAQARFNSRVVELIGMGTYSCRGINGMAGARLSEHAFGNAMDVGGFRLADGRIISIVRDWYHGDEAAQAFLRDVHSGACSHFTTVLGPGYNIFHYNHFHVDLAMHGNMSTGPRRICRPTPQATPAPEHAPDGLPEPPPMDEDLDIAQAGAANAQALALHAPGGGNLDAAIPPPAPIASYHRMPTPGSAYRPPEIGRKLSADIDDGRRRSSRPRGRIGLAQRLVSAGVGGREQAAHDAQRRGSSHAAGAGIALSAAGRCRQLYAQVQIRAAARHDARGRSLCARRSPRRLGSLAISDGSSLFGSGP